jgi:hypothetical protein
MKGILALASGGDGILDFSQRSLSQRWKEGPSYLRQGYFLTSPVFSKACLGITAEILTGLNSKLTQSIEKYHIRADVVQMWTNFI